MLLQSFVPVGVRWSIFVTAFRLPFRCDAEPPLSNQLQPHQLASAANPHIPMRALAERAYRLPLDDGAAETGCGT